MVHVLSQANRIRLMSRNLTQNPKELWGQFICKVPVRVRQKRRRRFTFGNLLHHKERTLQPFGVQLQEQSLRHRNTRTVEREIGVKFQIPFSFNKAHFRVTAQNERLNDSSPLLNPMSHKTVSLTTCPPVNARQITHLNIRNMRHFVLQIFCKLLS